MELIKEIDKQIKKYSIELDNLKENKVREINLISDAEISDYDNQIHLTARIIKGLKEIKKIALS